MTIVARPRAALGSPIIRRCFIFSPRWP
jgi:hypothetical protein